MIRVDNTLGRVKTTSVLAKTPKAAKKINSYYYNKGFDGNLTAKQYGKCLKSGLNSDFLAGIDAAVINRLI